MPAASGYSFGPYRFHTSPRRLLRRGEEVAATLRQLDILHARVSRAGEVVSKDLLISAGWRDLNVSDSSLEKMIFQVRQHLDEADPHRYIRTVARRGYQFVAPVTRVDGNGEDTAVLLAPHRAWTEGRAALETLERDQVARARATFDQLVAHHSDRAAFHIGLANACAMTFEATRTDAMPDVEALRLAELHAQEACRLDPNLAEAWATLGFVLERTGKRDEARWALDRAVTLEPDNWLHLIRLTAASWGEERLRAARRTFARCPRLPMAHWLVASVYVARDALDQAEREVDAGLVVAAAESKSATRFSAVAFDWLKGLLCLARSATDEALAAFDREIALEARGHVYARECASNAWYARGACLVRTRDRDAARAAFAEAIARAPRHPMAHAGLAILDERHDLSLASNDPAPSVDLGFARAAVLASGNDVQGAAELVSAALRSAPPGNAGWLLPIEPLLYIGRARDAWTPALSALHLRAR